MADKKAKNEPRNVLSPVAARTHAEMALGKSKVAEAAAFTAPAKPKSDEPVVTKADVVFSHAGKHPLGTTTVEPAGPEATK